MTFTDWLSRHVKRDSPLGDLARDVSNDREFPTSNSKEDIESHLRRNNACCEAIDTFSRAWTSYQAYQKKHPEL